VTLDSNTCQDSSIGACVHLTIGDVRVAVQSDLKRLLSEVAALYPCESKTPTPSRTIRIEVRRTRRRPLGNRYRVYADGEEIGGERRSNEVFPFVEWAINLRVIATRSRYAQLHAASMAYRGNGFIFAGGSGSGKSTLAAGLMARGWKYFSDEFALVERDTLCLHPFPKPLCIKAGSSQVIRRLGIPFARCRDFIKSQKGRVGYINPYDIGNDSVGRSAPVRFVVFPTYVDKQQPKLRPISRTRALMDLAGCVFNRHAFDDQALSILHKVIGRAQCFRLETGDIQKTCQLIETELCQAPVCHQDEPSQRGEMTREPPGRNVQDSCATLSRRAMLKRGAILAYAAPTVMTLTAQQAFAATSNPSGICSTAVQNGAACDTDSDCCSGNCDFGVCI